MSTLEGYETAQEAAERYGIDDSQVRRYCAQGRITGAVKVGRQWLVPENAWPEESEVARRPPRWANVQRRELTYEKRALKGIEE